MERRSEGPMSHVAQCGPLTISSGFDSGNFLRAELVEPSSDQSVPAPGSSQSYLGALSITQQQLVHDYEVNIWTRPDCYKTPYENGNRTWFYFGIKGGKPFGTVKINVINLNKQSKLFMQGMSPVFRILPEKVAWERIKDSKIVLNENKSPDNACSISFRQRLPENPQKSTLYIAFTYPFSYLEMCDLLKDLDAQFYNTSPSRFPFPSTKRREVWMTNAAEKEIYYHRECVCYSFEGNRVDLLTISSMCGISEQREDRLMNLFPIKDEARPFKFPGKKVVFLSARVHPGETPSSFVINGFIKFILDKRDPRAVTLRKLFVFKIIPILNPDGVSKGHYRTDPRGVNLNRMYLNPSPVYHPSIYAARKLLIYYHNGNDAPDDYEFAEENTTPSGRKRTTSLMDQLDKPVENVGMGFSSPCQSESACQVERHRCSSMSDDSSSNIVQSQVGTSASNSQGGVKKPYTFVLSDANSLCAGCVPFADDAAQCCSSLENSNESQSLSDSLNEAVTNVHQCAFEACDEDSVFYENLKANDVVNNNMEVDTSQGMMAIIEPESSNLIANQSSRPNSPRRRKKGSAKGKKKKGSKTILAEVAKDKKVTGSKSLPKEENLLLGVLGVGKSNLAIEGKVPRATRSQMSSFGLKSNSRYHDPSSGLFLYVDMHGHTTKRGIFMYGNHFPDVNTQSECMLVPRLMAINSPHFDFAACNFTERLMCVKDRRDGASREGSGRVACLKLTGLIRSYTLECNYNTGRIVNQVASRPVSYGFMDPPEASFTPPKFTIELFEGVGKALGESILDLTGQNPWSRLNLTEFKSLDGIKRALISRLKLSPEYKTSSSDFISIAKKSTTASFDSNPVLSNAIGVKPLKKPKNKVLVPSQPSGPLGPRRENQNSPAVAKPSGSQVKKLPVSEASSDFPIPGTSSILPSNLQSNLPKSSLAKVMKKKNFPKFASSQKLKKVKTKKKKTLDKTE